MSNENTNNNSTNKNSKNYLEKIKNLNSDNITGVLAIIAGLILLGFTYKLLLAIIMFFIGCLLIYFGLLKLKVTRIIDFIQNIINKIKSKF